MIPDNLFNVSLREYPFPQQRGVTDTAPTIPVYFIHSFEQPFCMEQTCLCQAQRQEVVRLFVKIVEGHVELEPAADLLDGEGK